MFHTSSSSKTVADLGSAKDVLPHPQSNIFFIFMQFSAKIMPNNRLAPNLLWVDDTPSPFKNSGSTTDACRSIYLHQEKQVDIFTLWFGSADLTVLVVTDVDTLESKDSVTRHFRSLGHHRREEFRMPQPL